MTVVKIKYQKRTPLSTFDVDFPNLDDSLKKSDLADQNDVVTPGEQLHEQMKLLSRAFINAGESHLFVMPFVSGALLGLIAFIVNAELLGFLEKNAGKTAEQDDVIDFELPYERLPELTAIVRRINSAHHAGDGYSKSLILQLSTAFDILVAGIVKQVVQLKPSVLEASDRKVDFVDLKKFSSLEDLRQSFIDKTVDTVVRRSRSEQFAWLSDKLDIRLNKDLDGWCDFIEINERRNLFTHTEGLVTKEYVENCVAAGCKRESLSKLGEKLSADDQYVKHASELFFVIGIKLTQVIWRKLSEDFGDKNVDEADTSLIVLTFDLNRSNNPAISSQLGSFACGDVIKRYGNERSKRTLYVNYAAALMLQDKDRDARFVLDRLDWNIVSQDFGMSVAAIKGDIDRVCQLMPQAVKAEVVSKADLEEWPVFFKVRNDQRYTDAFESLFEEKFIPKVSAKRVDKEQRKEVANQLTKLAADLQALQRSAKSALQ